MASEPNVVTMNVSLPAKMKKFVDGQVATGVYGSVSEFVRQAIREKMQREQARLQPKDAMAAEMMEAMRNAKSRA